MYASLQYGRCGLFVIKVAQPVLSGAVLALLRLVGGGGVRGSIPGVMLVLSVSLNPAFAWNHEHNESINLAVKQDLAQAQMNGKSTTQLARNQPAMWILEDRTGAPPRTSFTEIRQPLNLGAPVTSSATNLQRTTGDTPQGLNAQEFSAIGGFVLRTGITRTGQSAMTLPVGSARKAPRGAATEYGAIPPAPRWHQKAIAPSGALTDSASQSELKIDKNESVQTKRQHPIQVHNPWPESPEGSSPPWQDKLVLALPSAPRELTATATERTITLTWLAPLDAGDSAIIGYRVQRRQRVTWTDVTRNTESVATEFVHSGLGYNKVWTYRVAAVNDAGTGSYTPGVNVTTPDLIFSVPEVTFVVDYESVTLRWPAVTVKTATVQSYQLEYYYEKFMQWAFAGATVDVTPVMEMTHGSDENPLVPGTTYRYRLLTRSIDPFGASVYDVGSVTTRAVDANVDPQPGVGPADTLFLYHVLSFAAAETPPSAAEQDALLTPLVHPFGDATGVGLAPAKRRIQVLQRHDLYGLGDLNGTPRVDPEDAKILYYASAFPELLGNGRHGGFSGLRAELLAELSGLENPTDLQLQERLRLARTNLIGRD